MIRPIFLATLALPFSVSASPLSALNPLAKRQSLPLCSNIDQPCSCPNGTTFRNISTYAIIGATARDIGAVVDDFDDAAWSGIVVANLTGTDNVVGATRQIDVSSNGAGFTLTEQLIEYQVDSDGSFVQRYRQNPTPAVVTIPAALGGGSFNGYWETLSVQQTLVANESAVFYGAYRCDVGTPFDTVSFHENSINNASSILSQEGKLTGVDVAPFSITSLVSG